MPGPIEPPIARDLRRLWLRLRGYVERELAQAGFGDVTAPHLAVIAHPGPDGQRPSALAEREGMSKQAMNHLIGHLERHGYLERRPDPADSRARLLYLTPRGQELARHVQGAVGTLEHEWAQRLGPKRYEALRAAVRDLVDAR